jgi:hypothetical protein
VLREAGLITTRRKQNTVWHSLTPLGQALISRNEAVENSRGDVDDLIQRLDGVKAR